MPSTTLLDACGRRRSAATLPSFHQGRPPRNKGQRYPADPPTVEQIIAVMHAAGEDDTRSLCADQCRSFGTSRTRTNVHHEPPPGAEGLLAGRRTRSGSRATTT